MRIELKGIARRFGKQWVLKDIDSVFLPGSRTCITGPNGSGKSTLLRIISGNISPNHGGVTHFLNEKEVPREKLFQYLALAAPYLDVYEDLTVKETVELQASFKPFCQDLSISAMLEAVNIPHAADKPVKDLSSGMKQRLKLALAIFADTPLVLLDEPTSNLDEAGVIAYNSMMAEVAPERTVIVCSNDTEREAAFCGERLSLA